jgi:hypothetical protein
MTKINHHRRLQTETFDIDFVTGDCAHKLAVSLARDDAGTLRELVFVTRPGHIGEQLDLAFRELGIQLSRCIQGRDPQTGARRGQ